MSDNGYEACWLNPMQSAVRSNANDWSSGVQFRTFLVRLITLGKHPSKGSWFAYTPKSEWTSAVGLAVLVIAIMAAMNSSFFRSTPTAPFAGRDHRTLTMQP